MRNSAKTLLVSFSLAAAAAAYAMPAAYAATDSAGSKFKTFEATPKAERVETKEATPKAERVEPDAPRQIVVEPKQEAPETPVAALNPPVGETEPVPQKAFTDTDPQQDAAANPPQQPEVTEKPVAEEEDVFAPQTKAAEEKVEMPTVFTEKQKTLFNDLSTDDQKQLVAKLVKKYGYDTMYPKNVTRNYAEDYKAKQSYADERNEYSYNDDSYTGGYNSYSSGYGSGYANCQ